MPTTADMATIVRATDELEKLIDRHGLSSVLDMMANVCHLKAEHIALDWQDKPLAANWTRAGRKLDTMSRSAVWLATV